jgi:hypothetical protein
MKHMEIFERCCAAWNTSEEEILSWVKKRKLARKRQVLAWKLYQLNYMSYPAVGRLLGRHHTTIMHAVEVVDALIEQRDPYILSLVNAVRDHEPPPERTVGPDFLFIHVGRKERAIVPPLVRTITPRVYV